MTSQLLMIFIKMKKIVFSILFIFLLIGCGNSSSNCSQQQQTGRIEVLYEERVDDIYYRIILVDGHQYIVSGYEGGICHLESCPCKTKKQ